MFPLYRNPGKAEQPSSKKRWNLCEAMRKKERKKENQIYNRINLRIFILMTYCYGLNI